MRDLSKELTVFVITCRNNINYKYCINALEAQTVKFKLDIIKDYAPMSKAFQEMIIRCKTKYYVQVDDDMILDSNTIELMYDKIVKSNKAMFVYMLKDVHLNFDIFGIKIYKTDIFKKYPYNLKVVSCEMEQLNRIKKDGYTWEYIKQIVGKHSPYWTDELIFERYYDLMQKYKLYKYYWMKKLPEKLLNIFLQNSSKQNLYALLGCIIGLSLDKIDNKEKDYKVNNSKFLEIKEYFT